MKSASVEMFERGLIEAGAQLVEKWAHFIDADGAPPVKDEYKRYQLARMLDTSDKVLQREALQTTTAFGTAYVKAMLGMTRQIFPRMFGTDFVSVQALDRPEGQIFHLALTRDDGSATGGAVAPDGDASGQGYSLYTVSKTYADHANGEGGAIAKSMALGITASSVKINKVKKLGTSASWELATDLQAYHNLNPMDLLQGAAVDEIAQEKDAEIVVACRAAAIANKTVTFGLQVPSAYQYAPDDYRKRIQRAILEADKAIYVKTNRHANVMAVGVDAFMELMDLNSFVVSPDMDWENASWGLQPVGTLNSQYKVFLSRALPDKEIIIGRKGSGFLDAGIVYSPYVDLFITDRFFDVNTQKTSQSFASRYDIFTISNGLYARIVLDPNSSGITA
jgi:hypothetical protein